LLAGGERAENFSCVNLVASMAETAYLRQVIEKQQ